MDSSGVMKMDAGEFHQVYVGRKDTGSGNVVRDFDLNIPFSSDSCMPISEGSCEVGHDGPPSPGLQLMPLAPVIHRQKRSHINRQPNPPIPSPLLVCDQPRIVGSAVESHHWRPFVTLSTASTTCSPQPYSADHKSSAAAFAPDDERRCPTSLRIDVDELFTPIKKGKFISLTLNFYKE